MAWGGKGGWHGDEGPWGKTPGSGGGGGGNPPPPDRQKPDLEEILQRSQDRFKSFFSGDGDNRKTILIGALALVLLWLASGVYVVEPEEQGVVVRFGTFHRVTEPGLNYHLPYPIENVATPKVTTVNRVEIGGRGAYGNETLMLTGDENIVDINFEVQWRISNPKQYLFNIRNPEQTVRAVSESAMREVVSRSPLTDPLISNRKGIAREAQTLMQEMLNLYQAGIEVISVNMTRANPPEQVIDAFRDVQAARANQEQSQNQAEAYRNTEIPKARGQAEQRIQDAEAYKAEVVALARGDASRFSAVYQQFVLARDVTKRRLYIETMESVLKDMNKVIVDPKAAIPYLPLSELKPAAGPATGGK